MSRQTPIVCVAEGKVPGLLAALKTSLKYSVTEARPSEAQAVIAEARPAAVIIAEPQAEPRLKENIAGQVEAMKGAYVPVLAHVTEGSPASLLPMPVDTPPSHAVARLGAALRIQVLHATVLRRAGKERATIARAEDGATVLVAGRGGSYPALSTAVGEKVGLIGALSLETAQRYLERRDIDGLVIGDGFGGRTIEAFIATLGADVRFRDLPVIVADSRVGALDFAALPNADRIRGGADHVLAHLLPLTRLHAFGARLKRLARALEADGLVDAETGLMTSDAFMRDLTRAIEECRQCSGKITLARFSFPHIDRRAGIDAARIVSRLVRDSDFACRNDDSSIHVAFGATDLRAAHVVARRIASVLKHTMLSPGADASSLAPEVALVTRQASDSAETLLARLSPAIAAE